MPREITVIPYDESWPYLYEKEKALLLQIFGNLASDIHHFGSTSIKGMAAKPIIDIMIVADDLSQIDDCNEALEAYGYIAKGENGIPGRRYFVKLNPDQSGNHTHHVHVYQAGNRHIESELMFRDYLRIDPEAFEKYVDLKKEAALKYRYDPPAYTDAKSACVMEIMEKAKSYFSKHPGL
jgi:GrpB-like predicted nucleotidyltransferase (UPF0157 family)